METLNICLVGFGSVNRALVRLVAREAEWLQKHHSLDVQVSAIVARHGAWEPRSGDYLPPVAVLARLADMVAAGEARLDAGSLAAAAATLGIDAATVLATTAPPTAAVLELIARRLARPADGRASVACLAEAVDVDYAAGEPATSYLRAALSVGAHAVSANKVACPLPPPLASPTHPVRCACLLAKGPVVHARAALLSLARDKGVRYLHESAVMDGLPQPNPNPSPNRSPNRNPDPRPHPQIPPLTQTLTRRAHLLHLGGRLPSRRRACPRPEPACVRPLTPLLRPIAAAAPDACVRDARAAAAHAPALSAGRADVHWSLLRRQARLRRLRGALNSTSSVVLSGMEQGQTMGEALAVAQEG